MSRDYQINYDNPTAFEDLSLIIDEYEKAALRNGSRQAILATAQNPLSAMDQILKSSNRALDMGKKGNSKRVSSRTSSQSTTDNWEPPGFRLAGSGLTNDSETGSEPWIQNNEGSVGVSSDVGFNADDPFPEPSLTIEPEGSFGFDADFNELFNGEPGGQQFGDWLKDCLGCDLRISFNWQLQPIDLLLPLANLLADINNALDQFEGWLDPNPLMNDLCNLLNGLNFLCLPDLIAILMALKMLLKSYLTFQLSIRIDWTVLLGPILKLILDAIATLLQQIAAIIVAPLDCAYSALMMVSNLQDQLAETAALAAAVGARVGDRVEDVKDIAQGNGSGLEDNITKAESLWKDISGSSEVVEGDSVGLKDITIPSLEVNPRRGSRSTEKEIGFSLPVGFDITSNTRLPDALKVPAFLQSNPFKKMALTVQEAKNYIMDLVRKIILALRSLEGLVSGNLGLSLGNLGLLLFIRDMIRLIMVIIQLFQGRKVDDWCEFLRNNPEVLEQAMPGTRARVDADQERIVLTRGSEVVAEISTCLSDKPSSQTAMMQKWIKDLNRSEGS